jgi:hypothetical protein
MWSIVREDPFAEADRSDLFPPMQKKRFGVAVDPFEDPPRNLPIGTALSTDGVRSARQSGVQEYHGTPSWVVEWTRK